MCFCLKSLISKPLVMGLCLLSLSSWQSFAQEKSEALDYLKDLKSQNQERLEAIDRRLGESIGAPLLPEVSLEKQIFELRGQKNEHLLRQLFLDRLIFQIDSHFKTGSLQSFLQTQLLAMAKVDLINPSANSSLWKFLTYLSRAIETLPEKNEDILAFVEGYMKSSPMLSPLPPEEFLRKRAYTNGKDVLAAAGVPKDKIGEVVEKSLNHMTSQAPVIELKTPLESPRPLAR